MPIVRVVLPITLLLLLVAPAPAATPPADPDDPEGVGAQMGYRMYGKAHRDRPLLLQNSRPFPVQVFDEVRGVYVVIPRYSDREFPCHGKARVLHVRFTDDFGEGVPFQVRIGCGRELQFIAKTQIEKPVPIPEVPLAEPPVNPPPPPPPRTTAEEFPDIAIEPWQAPAADAPLPAVEIQPPEAFDVPQRVR